MAEGHAGGVGTTLREARERRGISLQHIAKATKIPIRTLEALERNDISHLPSGIFGRAFVRAYAAEVDLDPEETIQEFIAQFPQDSVTAGHPAASPIEDNLAIESDRRTASAFLRMILFSIPIAGVLLYFVGRPPAAVDPRPAPASVLPTRPAAPAPIPLASDAIQAPSQAIPSPPPGYKTPSQAIPSASPPVPSTPPAIPSPPPATPSPIVAPSSAPARLTIRLAATGPVWISAIVDGVPAIERRFEAGERQVFEVRGDLILTTGNPETLVVTINGVQAKPLGKAGETVTTHFTRDNFKEYLVTP